MYVQSYKAKQIIQLLKWQNIETVTIDNTDVKEYFVLSKHLVEINLGGRVSQGQLKNKITAHFCQTDASTGLFVRLATLVLNLLIN